VITRQRAEAKARATGKRQRREPKARSASE